ncbi:SMI1/KNR4 family protein [Affinibrenneria salicis]|uniref:SMI1/KNR4 family protein n=1 Tax=Affinibrenneria salicis TaxID=2590031 RepID=A0A5J5G234_9GAMM|nr:SMI1/KNR4 family protein [Affinibrenneria salicis]KAA9000685.1 SMI1/KNR4 family protein [Affinibrenneria salicis]
MDAELQQISRNWRSFALALERIGADVRPLIIDAPADDEQILRLERQLGGLLPASLKTALRVFSSRVDFRWSLPSDLTLEKPLHQIFSGGVRWSPAWLQQCNDEKNVWVSEVFNCADDPYDRVWRNKLAFQAVGNGDFLAIDTGSPHSEAVVYLSHDDGDGHGRVLAPDFITYLLLSSRLGAVGAEDWQWLPFISPQSGGLDPDGASGRAFRAALQVVLPAP